MDDKALENSAATGVVCSDMVRRLREIGGHEATMGNRFHARDLRAAADEIERLRSALEKLAACESSGDWARDIGCVNAIARMGPGAPHAKGEAQPDDDRIYPCDDCGTLRTKAEGGTTFTVCDDCWDKRLKTSLPNDQAQTPAERDQS